MSIRITVALTILGLCLTALAAPVAVRESAREIPVAYTVDVLVVGGSTGAVSAAVEASKAGASVFLAAPRTYLGEDMCGPMRLWLEPGEEPASALAKAIYTDAGGDVGAAPINLPANAIPYKYQASIASSPKHKDTNPPSILSDGKLGSASNTSVQYDGDVVITADLGKVLRVTEARIIAFHRDGDFTVETVGVQVSDDGKAWKDAAGAKRDPAFTGSDVPMQLSAPVKSTCRYVKLSIKKPQNMERLLLGEIMFLADINDVPPAPVAQDKSHRPIRPMHVKKTLDDALLAAKVQYLFGCYPTELLRDAEGKPCGIVMANRSGRQAIVAKVIIDATDRGVVARLAGAQFGAYPKGNATFNWNVIASDPKKADSTTARIAGVGFGDPKGGFAGFKLIEYTMQIAMPDASWRSFAAAEQIARDRADSGDLEANTDEIFQIPPDSMKGQTGELGAFRPAGVDRLYVLSGSADMPREEAAKLMRPIALIDAGAKVGAAATIEAKAVAVAKSPAVAPIAGLQPDADLNGDVKELLLGVRPTLRGQAKIASPQRALPVLGQYDVVVIGGGTGGAPAAISAARRGAKTLCVEYLHELGGVGTAGLISSYYWGYRKGFTAEAAGGVRWDPLERAEWYRSEIRKAGGDIWFGVVGCGAYVQDGTVRGAIVATPHGRGVVLARVVIDATGNSDVAAAAGAQTMHTDAEELAQQGTGLPPRKLSASYNNTDYDIVDETDLLDVWHMFVYAKSKFPNAFDLGQLIDTRERRRIVGEFVMTLPDQLANRTYPDTISIAYSNFDTHGYTVEPALLVEHPEKKGVTVNVPYRCLLPKGLDNILVIGLGMSVHRDAVPLTRMQPDIMNQGFSAGMIAADCAKKDISTRSIDLKPIQAELVKKEIIPESALTAKDSFPLPQVQLQQAVKEAAESKGMAVIASHREQAIPLLREAFANAADAKTKKQYAFVLAAMGDATGIETLIAAIDAAAWDKGWNYKGMGQFGSSLSEVDRMIVAAGRTKDKRLLPVLLKKIAALDASKEFSHHRAVALAAESIGSPEAAAAIAELLKKPGMMGYVHSSVDVSRKLTGMSGTDESTRATSLRELFLARALYRCGDKDGLGKQILQQYTQDLRGHLARHATAVLEEKK